jgi:hypothetical protein
MKIGVQACGADLLWMWWRGGEVITGPGGKVTAGTRGAAVGGEGRGAAAREWRIEGTGGVVNR